MAVDRRAETVKEGDGARARPRSHRGIISTCGTHRFAEESLSAKQPFDLAEKDPCQSRHGLGPVGKESSEPLWHRNYPLPNRHRGYDSVGEMRSYLCHPAAVAGGTDAAALAREGHDKTLPARSTTCPAESEAEDAAGEVRPQLPFDVRRNGLLSDRPILEPAFEVLCDSPYRTASSPVGVARSGGNSQCRRAGGLWTAPETRRGWRPWPHRGKDKRLVSPYTRAATSPMRASLTRAALLNGCLNPGDASVPYVAATVHPGTAADMATVIDTAIGAAVNLDRSNCENTINVIVADKGYHSTKVVTLAAELGIRTYIPEPTSATHRRWTDNDPSQKQAVNANHRRTRGNRGKQLSRLRSELTERSFAHVCDTGRARRTWLRGLVGVTKRHLMMVAARNLPVIIQALCGFGSPKALQGLRTPVHPHINFPQS